MSRTLAVVGLGNIGSHLAPSVARMPEVARVILVDKGVYDRTNLGTQAITTGGGGKAQGTGSGAQAQDGSSPRCA